MTIYQIQLPVTWRGPVPNESGGMRRPVHGVIIHIMDGTLWGTDGWFHNLLAKASSDYGVGKKDKILQWVDWTTNWKAWAEAAGNPYWVSIENEGKSGEPLTDFQIEANAQIIAHVFTMDGVPFVKTSDVNGRGLGWHGMGGKAWGGHPNCPGDPVRAQFDQILDRALVLVGGGTPLPSPINPGSPAKDEEVKYQVQMDPESGGSWKVRIEDGAVYADDGAPFLGGLNTHSEWHAGADESEGHSQVQGLVPCRDGNGEWGYKIWIFDDRDNLLHPYMFPRDKSQAGHA
jgi:hypothetical protein